MLKQRDECGRCKACAGSPTVVASCALPPARGASAAPRGVQALSRRHRRRVARAQRTHGESGAAVRVRWPSQARTRARAAGRPALVPRRAPIWRKVARLVSCAETSLRRHKWQCKVGNNDLITRYKMFTFPVCDLTFLTQQHASYQTSEKAPKPWPRLRREHRSLAKKSPKD